MWCTSHIILSLNKQKGNVPKTILIQLKQIEARQETPILAWRMNNILLA